MRCKRFILKEEDETRLLELAELFKVFGDSTRVKILYVLGRCEELCVQHIAENLSMTQPAVSHQLRVLRSSKLVKTRREGKKIFYSLDDDHVSKILNQGMEHIME